MTAIRRRGRAGLVLAFTCLGSACSLFEGDAPPGPVEPSMSDHMDVDAIFRSGTAQDAEAGSTGESAVPAGQAAGGGPAAEASPAPATTRPAPPAPAAPVVTAPLPEPRAVPEPPPGTGADGPLPESEAWYNDAIRGAVAEGDVDRALRLLAEAERLGSTTARRSFIEAVNAR